MNYKTYVMSDLIADISMGPFGSNIKAECYQDQGVPYLNGSNVTGFSLNEKSFRYVSEEKADSLGRSVARRKDIIVTHRGTLGQIAYIPENSKFERYVTGNSQFRFTCNDKVLPEYVVLFFHTPKGQHILLSNASQVGVPALARPTSTFQKLAIDIPDIEYQKKVCSIFQVIQDKIELNNAINENLQQQAQSIFTNMFETEDNELWESGTLSDIADIIMGQSPSGSSYNEDGQGTVFFQGRAEFSFRYPTIRLFTTEPKRMALRNDTLMSVRAPVGDLNIAHEDCCIGRGLAAIRSKNKHQSFVHYTMFSLQKKLDVFNGEGTVFGSINRNSLNAMPIKLPPKELMDEFESIVAPIDALILANHNATCHLQVIRDTLLPKLMNGELDISNMDI